MFLRTSIVRRDPAEQITDQVLVANIDRVAVVHGLDQPANEARIERFLVLAIDSGAPRKDGSSTTLGRAQAVSMLRIDGGSVRAAPARRTSRR